MQPLQNKQTNKQQQPKNPRSTNIEPRIPHKQSHSPLCKSQIPPLSSPAACGGAMLLGLGGDCRYREWWNLALFPVSAPPPVTLHFLTLLFLLLFLFLLHCPPFSSDVHHLIILFSNPAFPSLLLLPPGPAPTAGSLFPQEMFKIKMEPLQITL